MHYEINVSLNGRHYFATHNRSIHDRATAERIYWDFVERFPKHQGFDITVAECQTTGRYFKPKRPKVKK
jgi:hypothetical protein